MDNTMLDPKMYEEFEEDCDHVHELLCIGGLEFWVCTKCGHTVVCDAPEPVFA